MAAVSQQVLDEIVRRLVEQFDPEEIILFGSQAWGSPSAGSDVDLLVIVSDSELSQVQRATLAHRALRGLNVSKDVLVKTRREVERFRGVPASLEAEILERGRRLYG
jgi:predicted nucleotidyltransferase